MVAFKDITGQKFNRLLVIERGDNSKSGKSRFWCLCDCGNTILILKDSIVRGHTRSCGCLSIEDKKSRYLDLTGEVYGRLTVIERSGYVGDRIQWRAICTCGNEAMTTTESLRSGKTQSCGCLQKENASKSNRTDLVGSKFGRLTVMSRMEPVWYKSTHVTRYLCLCDCGNQTSALLSNLTTGKTKSCGCYRDEVRSRERIPENLVGYEFGRMVVTDYIGRDARGNSTWRVVCSCGEERVLSTAAINSGDIVSCGCYGKEQTMKRWKTHGLSNTPEYDKMMRKKRRDLVKLHDSEWTYEMELLIYETFDSCVVCNSNTDLTVDHVKPLSAGFGLKPGNAVILCRSCNSSKSNKDLSSLPQDVQSKILTAAALFKEVWDNYVPEVYEDDTEDNDWEGWI